MQNVSAKFSRLLVWCDRFINSLGKRVYNMLYWNDLEQLLFNLLLCYLEASYTFSYSTVTG